MEDGHDGAKGRRIATDDAELGTFESTGKARRWRCRRDARGCLAMLGEPRRFWFSQKPRSSSRDCARSPRVATKGCTTLSSLPRGVSLRARRLRCS
jgi:hypothetical protein